MKYFFVVLLCGLVTISLHSGRSVFRTKDPNIPTLIVRWKDTDISHTLRDSHLEAPLFLIFDKHYFETHMLPDNDISYRYEPTRTVTGSILGTLIQTAIDEIKQGKKIFTHFIILKKRDFHNGSGLIILKFKNHPFVVKLFIETPESFVTPWEKGFESMCFFNMGGGINRHLMGFTRIKNLEHIKATLAKHPYWQDKVSFPRKWFWMPKYVRWLELKGKNIGTGTTQGEIPSVYAVVADHIAIKRTFTLQQRKDRRIAVALSSYLKSAIDLHINNYVIEEPTGDIVIIDTEHFPTLVGLWEEPPSQSYLQWYIYLARKMVHYTFERNKQERYARQLQSTSPMHISLSINV